MVARVAPNPRINDSGSSSGSEMISETEEKSMEIDENFDIEAGQSVELFRSKKFPAFVVLRLAYQSLGVVYGDVGTSPLYVFHSTFSKVIPDKENILGVLSLIIYTIILIPLIKYTFFVMRANDQGEGGTFALYSTICRHAKINTLINHYSNDKSLSVDSVNQELGENSLAARVKRWIEGKEKYQHLLLILVIFGTCMVIGDGVLTPAISVLSSVGGIKVQYPHIDNGWVVAIAVVILTGLFNIQRFGTGKIGWVFAPSVLIWFLSIGSIGIYNIVKYDPSVLRAFSPLYIVRYFSKNKLNGWVSLGGIFLSVTGTEALYADLGHFSALSIQLAFAILVFPCLLAAYMGQAAFLMKFPEHVHETFYRSIPDPVYWPMFVVATVAAIIASQATISATFSIIKQAEALGCFPRVKVVHMSDKFYGQIYIPEINWILMILCLVITAGFKETTQIGNAYGIAVVAVMLVTTVLMALIMLFVWQSNFLLVMLFTVVFLGVELIYFSAVLFKLNQGGWAPLVIAFVLVLVMYVWYYGNLKRFQFEIQSRVSMGWILRLGPSLGLVRVPGIGLLYTDSTHGVPSTYSHFVTHLPAIHRVIVFVAIQYLPVKTISQESRFLIQRIGTRDFFLFRCVVRYGYMDLQKKDDNFEKNLLDELARFIRDDTCIEQNSVSHDEDTSLSLSVSLPPPSLATNESPHSTILSHDFMTLNIPNSHSESRISSNDSIVFEEEEGGLRRQVISSGVGDYSRRRMRLKVRFAPLPAEEEPESANELRILCEAREAGVVHILGAVILRAKRESNIVKKFAVDYAYAFLRKICRERSTTFDIPHESVFNIGQVYYV